MWEIVSIRRERTAFEWDCLYEIERYYLRTTNQDATWSVPYWLDFSMKKKDMDDFNANNGW